MGFRATLNFRKFKVALNPMYRASFYAHQQSQPVATCSSDEKKFLVGGGPGWYGCSWAMLKNL